MKFPWSHTTIVDALKKDAKIEEKSHKVTEDISHGKLDIAEFVEELGQALTHDEPEMRRKATMLLSNVLVGLPTETLNEVQIKFLCTFYCDRIKDHHSVIPAILIGTLALSKMKNLPDGCATLLLRQLFQHIPCQSQAREDRTRYQEALLTFADRKEDELKAMGADFIYGVISTVEGERDPRNLLFLFERMPTLIAAYPLYHLAEEMFETFACYYPIDFHPNPGDPNAITRQLLSDKLANCLCASEDFAVHCIPLLLEKLDSELSVAKVDSLALLIRCAQNFPAAALESHLQELWKALKPLFFPVSLSNDEELYKVACTALSELVRSLSDANDGSMENFLSLTFITATSSLADVSSKLFDFSVKFAIQCAIASSASALYVSSRVLPLILTQLTMASLELSQEVTLTLALQSMLIVCKQKKIIDTLDKDLLGEIQKQLTLRLLQGSYSSELKRVSLWALTSVPEIVTDENRFAVYGVIVDVLLKVENASYNAESSLYAFAVKYPEEVMVTVVEKLLEKSYDDFSSPGLNRTFRALGKLATLPNFKDKVIEFLLGCMFANPVRLRIAVAAMNVLKEMVDNDEEARPLANALYNQHKLFEKVYDHIHCEHEDLSCDYLYAMSNLMKAITRKLSVDDQRNLITVYLPKMDLQKVPDLYLTSGIVGYLDETVVLENHFENLVTDLTKLALESEDERVQEVCHHLLCSLFNKMPDDDHHRGVLKKLLHFLKDELKKHNRKAVAVLSWIGKGLIARGHRHAGEVIDDIADLLDHPTLGHVAVLAFEVLSLEFPQLHLALVTNLFKQKLFVLVMKKLEQKIEKSAETHLTALAHIIHATPHMVLKMNIEKAGPLMMKCLAQENDHVLVHVLPTVLHFIRDKDVFFQNHFQTLIPLLLKLSSYQSSMDVRIESLNCLLYVTKYPTFLLLPHKQDVLTKIKGALDDPKRLVRQAAVAARLQWFAVGSEESEQ